MDFDWNAIRSFLRVAKTGTLSAAAADLGLSQPTVGRHISRLEESLGLRLFDHNQSGFELTEAGEQLLEAANHMAQSAADVQRRAKAANPVREAVRLTIEVRPWSLRLASRNIDRLAPTSEQERGAPPINFTFLSQDEYLSISRLEADLAIRNRVPKQGNLISVKLGYLTYRIFGSNIIAISTRTPSTLHVGRSRTGSALATPARIRAPTRSPPRSLPASRRASLPTSRKGLST